jgi:hypothetical protein
LYPGYWINTWIVQADLCQDCLKIVN